MRWSRRFFRMLLSGYPFRTRNEHGDDMWRTFECHLRDAKRRGAFAVAQLWWRELIAVWRDGRQARRSLGKLDRLYVNRNRPQKGREWLMGMSGLDFKLGFRMLVKYPGLTMIGGIGIAVALAIGVGAFGFIESFADPTLPFEEDERLVTIQNWDVERNRSHNQFLHDVEMWRVVSRSIVNLGAAIRVPGRNLITQDGRVEPVRLAVMHAAGFQVTRVPPFIGRTLHEVDESPAAPHVVVLGFDVWRDVFASDPQAVGKRIQLADTEHTVVGVMPEGFAFPFNEEAWIPLRFDPLQYKRGEGPALITFGRLADGVTIKDARAELVAIGNRTAVRYPEANENLRPLVTRYALPFLDIQDPQALWLLRLWQGIVSLVLVVVCVNVAVLVYARTAMRQREIGIRTALGATRRRVVGQLFAEAFVLSAAAALVGLIVAFVAVRELDAFWQASVSAQQLPFWLDAHLSVSSVVYAIILTILSGVIIGVLPGLKATRRDVYQNLQRLNAGASSGSLGRTWTLLIVAQVGVAMAVLPVTTYQMWKQVQAYEVDRGFAAEEFLTARLVLEADSSQNARQIRAADPIEDLVRRLGAEPLVHAATFSRFGLGQGGGSRIEVDGSTDRIGSNGQFVYTNAVAVDYFETFDIQLLSGRSFNEGDLHGTTAPVIVNRTFARRVLGAENPVGQRVRYVMHPDDRTNDVPERRWFEIVGVVDNFAQNPNFEDGVASIYHPIAPGHLREAALAVKMRGNDMTGVTTRLREIAAAVDPTMWLYGIQSEGHALRQQRRATRAMALVASVVMSCVILLSSAGVYALMSFTVTRRRREIGIRTALGGPAQRILLGVFARAVAQITAGIFVGATLAAVLDLGFAGALLDGHGFIILPFGAVLMMAVGLAAALGPARRGLHIQPTEALREDM